MNLLKNVTIINLYTLIDDELCDRSDCYNMIKEGLYDKEVMLNTLPIILYNRKATIFRNHIFQLLARYTEDIHFIVKLYYAMKNLDKNLATTFMTILYMTNKGSEQINLRFSRLPLNFNTYSIVRYYSELFDEELLNDYINHNNKFFLDKLRLFKYKRQYKGQIII